jgi:hypothetical protein
MRSLTQLITSFIFALLVSSLAFSGHAISSDQPKPQKANVASETPKNYEDVNPERRELEDEHVEISEIFNHASEQRWCLDCHNPDDRDVLRLANGDLVPFEESYNLCGQCHGTIFRDWKAGIHGKRTGEWNGKKQYRLCVHCHNPHSPKFRPIKPLPPPDNPLEIKYKKLKDDEIPRNPLGNIQ